MLNCPVWWLWYVSGNTTESIYILIGESYPFSTFKAHLQLEIHMPTCSLSSYLAASAKSGVILFRQLWLWGGNLADSSLPMFTGLSGNTWETGRKAHESHNDVRRLCWHAGAIFVLLAELGLRWPPSGNPEGRGVEAGGGARGQLPPNFLSQWDGYACAPLNFGNH